MKKLISILMTICMLAGLCTTFTVSTSASSPVYYESFQIFQSYYKSDAKSLVQDHGYTLYDFDLNTSTWFGSDCIFLGYKTTTDPNNAITDIVARIGKNCNSGTWVNEKNGCTYKSIGGYDDNDYYSAMDVNDSTGGSYVYLYVTKDPKAGNPITDLKFTQDDNTLRNFYVIDAESSSRLPVNLNEGGFFTSENYISFNRATYYSSLQLGAALSTDEAVSTSIKNGYSLLSYVDLNDGAGGNFIHLLFKTTTDKSDAIRDIICVSGQEYASMDSITYNGCTYYPVDGYYCNAGYPSEYYSALDVNKGVSGDYLYLFYTKDEKAGDPITYLTVNYSESTNEGWNSIKFKDTTYAADLNRSVGGEYIYLIYQKSTNAVVGSQFAD